MLRCLVAAISLTFSTGIAGIDVAAKKVEISPEKPGYVYRATVTNIVDGDTLDVTIDLGFNTFVKKRLRMLGVFAAESNTNEGKRHKDNLIKLLPIGSEVVVVTNQDRMDKYGRNLAKLWIKGSDVNTTQQSFIGKPVGKGVK